MRASARFDMVLWANPPHEMQKTIPDMLRLLDDLCVRGLLWHIEAEPERASPVSKADWMTLAEAARDPKSGSLDVFLESPSGLNLSMTVDWPDSVRSFDVLTVLFEVGWLSGPRPILDFEKLRILFQETIKLLRPFWARVADREVIDSKAGELHLSVDVTKVPATIHWFNYFDNHMVERLGGKKKFLRSPAYVVEEIQDPPGMLLILQRDPFDYHNLHHRWRLWQINRYFGLKRLHALYPRDR